MDGRAGSTLVIRRSVFGENLVYVGQSLDLAHYLESGDCKCELSLVP